MKLAFTLLELIIVMIIIGIISVIASTAFQRDTLNPATNQLLDHIRYTQQLALNQDMFIPAPDLSSFTGDDRRVKDSRQWFKKWWQIQFHEDDGDYTIYSDAPTNSAATNQYDQEANDGVDQIATDPQSGEFLAGESSKVTEGYLRLANLKEEYGVEISMAGCGQSKHLHFDHLGRPHCSKRDDDGSDYPYTNLAQKYITVTLTDQNEENSKTICVTPISGYAYIAENNGCP